MNDESWLSRADAPAPATTRRQMLLGGAFLAAAAAGVAFQPRRVEMLLGNAKLDALVPPAFAGWRFEAASGLVLPPADQLRDKIYSQLVTRVYARGDGTRVMLVIAYSGAQDGTIQVHRPEVCYPASGFRLTTIAPHTTALAERARPAIALHRRGIGPAARAADLLDARGRSFSRRGGPSSAPR